MSVESNGSAVQMSEVTVNKGSLDDAAVLSIESSQSPERVESPQEIHKLREDTDDGEVVLSNPALSSNGVVNKVCLTWDNLCVDAELPPPSCFTKLKARSDPSILETYKKTKPILKNVTGVAEPGSLLAIMGASGAGKTTLLNVLSNQNVNNMRVGGKIQVNGKSMKSKIKNISAYCQQEDLFIGTLTVKEHLTFQALLRMDGTNEEKKARVHDVMSQLGLLKCKDTIIGVPGRIRGISGGENKRLSFASEIITNPNLLFVDEPTSGLDSFMAESVITALQNIARKEGKTVLATIHQPSSETFALFDRLLLMSEGRTAFLGSTTDAISFFSGVGYPIPPNYNPADHYIHTLAIIPSREAECKEKAKAICDAYDTQYGIGKQQMENGDSSKVETHHEIPQAPKFKVGIVGQFRAVLWRSWMAALREPFVTKLRLIQSVVIALIAGLVYLNQGNEGQDSVRNLNGALFFVTTTMTFNSITGSLYVFPAELPVFLKEHKQGMYRTMVYFICKTLAELPWYTLGGFIFSVIVYWMAGLRGEAANFFIFCGIVQLITQCALSFGYLVSAISPSVQIATSAGPPLMMPFLLFGGFFIKDESIPDYFIPLKYISWFKYSFEALQINQWDGLTIPGCVNSTIACFPDGEAVLKSSGYSADNMGLNIGVLFAIVIGFRFIALLFVLLRARRAR
eukprot:TCONS_00064161-protein